MKPRTKLNKAYKAKVDVEILTGIQLHKLKNLKLIGCTIRTITNGETISILPIIVDVTSLFSHLKSADTLLQVARGIPFAARNEQPKGCLLPL